MKQVVAGVWPPKPEPSIWVGQHVKCGRCKGEWILDEGDMVSIKSTRSPYGEQTVSLVCPTEGCDNTIEHRIVKPVALRLVNTVSLLDGEVTPLPSHTYPAEVAVSDSLPEPGEFERGVRAVRASDLLQSIDAEMWASEFVACVVANPRIPTHPAVTVTWFSNAFQAAIDWTKRQPERDAHFDGRQQ